MGLLLLLTSFALTAASRSSSSRFAAESECSPEGQHLFSAALLPTSFQDLETRGFMVPTDKDTIDHHAPKPCLPC